MNHTEKYYSFYTIARKETKRIFRIWIQTLLPPAVTMTLYFLIFGKLIGSRIGAIGSYSYIEYIAPGLIMMSIITNSYNNTVSSFFMAKFQKNIEELIVSSTPSAIIVLGFVFGGICRGLLVGAMVTGIAMLFSPIIPSNLGLMLATAFLIALLFSLAGFLNAIFANSFDEISIVPNFILTPLTYLGGVFFSTTMLPQPWQDLSKLNPILYMVNAFRYGLLGLSDIEPSISYIIIISIIVMLLLLDISLIKAGYRIKN